MKLRKTIKKNFSPLLAALLVTLLLAVMILMVGLIGRSIKDQLLRSGSLPRGRSSASQRKRAREAKSVVFYKKNNISGNFRRCQRAAIPKRVC